MSFRLMIDRPRISLRAMAGALCSLLLLAPALGCDRASQDPAVPPVASASAAADEVYFGPKFEPDRVVTYLFRADNMSLQQAAGQQMIERSDTEYVMRFTVTQVGEDGSASLTMTYDRFYTEGESFFGGKYLFDSTQTAPDPETDAQITEALTKLAACTITFKSDAAGTVDPASVTGTEEAVAAMEALNPLQGRAGEYRAEQLAQLFSSTWRVGNSSYTRDINTPWQDVEKTPVHGLGTWTFTNDYQKLQRSEDRVVLGMKLVMELDFQPVMDETIEEQLKILETKFDMLKGDWRYTWDPRQQELIERVGEIEFKWLIVQEPIFEGDNPVRTEQHQHVKTIVKRLDE